MKKVLLFLPLLFLAASCTKTINDLEITSSKAIEFSKTGGKSIISMTAYSDWTAKCDASWVTLSPASGTADSDGLATSVAVIVNENPEYDDRSATISITSNEKVFTISVTQKTRTAIILSDKEQTVSYEAQTLTVNGKANVSKTVKIPDADWITYTGTKSLESFDIVLNIEENDSETDRKGKVYVNSGEPGIGDTLTIIQTGKPSILFCQTPGIYSGRDMIIGYADYKTQIGLFNRTTGFNDFQIINASTRKYLLFTDIKPAGGSRPESPYSITVKQNMTLNLEPEFSLDLTVYKYENGIIWADDDKNDLGVIFKAE